MTLGINTVHFDVRSIKELGFEILEVVLGRSMPYEERIEQVESEMHRAKELGLKLSIHHPIFIPEWFEYDYLDAFFLDPDKEKRESSFLLLEENLKRYAHLMPEYFVIHFPGVYPDVYMENRDFEQMLNESIGRIAEMASKYEAKIYFEYFGSNIMFFDVDDWIDRICRYENLSILIDTGHLYFAANMRSFDYMQAFEKLSRVCGGYHIWTVKGIESYGCNDYYKRYHHIMPSLSQSIEDGWAFFLESMLAKIFITEKPVIIEASPVYGGVSYFLRSIEDIKKLYDKRGR